MCRVDFQADVKYAVLSCRIVWPWSCARIRAAT